MSSWHEDTLYAAARSKAELSPFFLAYDLARYESLTGGTRDGIAANLGCTPATLDLLSLCRSPNRDGRFRAQVETIASRFALDSLALAGLLREADAVLGFDLEYRDSGWLAAARDREDVPDGER